jgi:hypothetical protein
MQAPFADAFFAAICRLMRQQANEDILAVQHTYAAVQMLCDASAFVLQVVSLHCNLSEDTFHLLNEDRLNMMKKDATLINCSRGPVIDEVALTNFLQANENFRCACSYSLPSQHTAPDIISFPTSMRSYVPEVGIRLLEPSCSVAGNPLGNACLPFYARPFDGCSSGSHVACIAMQLWPGCI